MSARPAKRAGEGPGGFEASGERAPPASGAPPPSPPPPLPPALSPRAGRAGTSLPIQHPGVLGSAPLARIDDERAVLEGDTGETARDDADLVRAREHEGTQIDMAGRDPGGDEGRAGRQRQRRLGDEAFRRVAELAGKILKLALRRMRPDEHAIAARPVALLHHELRQVVEHVGERILLPAAPG